MGWGGGRKRRQGRRAGGLSQRSGCDNGVVGPPVSVLSVRCGLFRGPFSGGSGQYPGSVLDGEAHGQESAQVEGGDAVVEPVVVLLDPAVGHPPSSSSEPGDGAFDHGPVLAVGGLEALLGG